MLRSYDSRKEPPPEFDCKIWEAGRATCAIGLAFKAVTIGHSLFHDDGGGTFNPSPHALDEAVVNEWPGRDVGVFVSVGTGKRPGGSDANQTMWYEGFLGEFAEARRRLIDKIEGCERIHEYMTREHLLRRGVNVENYYRLNVEIGVGEFGMNEWNRLADISTSTRRYLGRAVERAMVQNAAAKLARIHRANVRHDRLADVPELVRTMSDIPEPMAVELPGDIPEWPAHHTPPSRQSYESGSGDHLAVHSGSPSPRTSSERTRPPPTGAPPPPPPRPPAAGSSPSRPAQPPSSSAASAAGSHASDDRLVVTAPTPAQWRTNSGQDKIVITSVDEHPRRSGEVGAGAGGRPTHGGPQQPYRIEPPPLPPKTPLPEAQQAPVGHRKRPVGGGSGGASLPYPMDDEAPPPVNRARKPDLRGR